MEIKPLSLLILFAALLLTACTTSKQPPTHPNNLPNAKESVSSETDKIYLDDSQTEIILKNASMDFIDSLGFKVAEWVGVEPVETKIVNGAFAEIKIQQDMTSIAYLRISDNADTDINPVLEGAFETKYSELIGDISVQFGYTIEGPMIATWSRDGYYFCFYQKAGEADAAQESFGEGVAYYIKDISLTTV